MGERWEERATDFSDGLARNRYRVFKEQTYDALVSLKQIFHYHFINAQAPIPEVQANIVRELEYQSSLELDPRTFDRLRGLPLASEIVRHARQDLVRRLDSYEVEQPETFGRVIEFIESKMMPNHVETVSSHLDDAENVRAKLDARGLKVSSSHVSLAALRERPDAMVKACRILGFDQLFMPSRYLRPHLFG
jgi:hypothetical protein